MPRAVHAATLDVSSLALSSTMMSCTVHSLMGSLAQPSCIVVYIVCNPAPRGSPFKLSLGLRSKLLSPTPSPSPQSLCVCWFLVFWPWVASEVVVWSRGHINDGGGRWVVVVTSSTEVVGGWWWSHR